MYKKKITLREKITLLRYFTNWKELCFYPLTDIDNQIEVANSNQSDLVTIEQDGKPMQLTRKERHYITMFGPLSHQKNMFEYQNIKFKCDPFDLEKGV